MSREKQELIPILAQLSNWLTDIIDDRLELKAGSTVLPPAIREEIGRLIDGRVSVAANTRIAEMIDEKVREAVHQLMKGPQLEALVEKVVDERVRPLIDERIAAALEGYKPRADVSQVADVVEDYFADPGNLSKLTADIDLDEVVKDVLSRGNFDIDFRG